MMFGELGLWLVSLAARLPRAGLHRALQAGDQTGGIPWWVWIIIILLLILLLWWWFSRRSAGQAASQGRTPEVAAPQEPRGTLVETPAVEPESVASTEVAASTPDDLTRIEGIGPKINGLLQQAGIRTFTQLAESSIDQLEHILSEAGLRALADPATWPEQAALASHGDWATLQTLQDDLKGGRRR